MGSVGARARWVVALLAAIVAWACAVASAGAQTYLAECSGGKGQVAPAGWSSGCVGASANFDSLVWSGWGAENAQATGQARPNDCDPDCARGTVYSYPARLIASGLRPCPAQPGSSQYSRLETQTLYPADNPFEQPPGWGGVVWEVDAADCTAWVPVLEQGVGIVLDRRPEYLEARRNIRPGSLSGRDVWTVRRWLSFGGPRAVAKATYWWHTPDGSGFRRFPVRLVLDRLGRCGDLYVYTRISGRFLRRKPPKMSRTVRKAPWRYEYC